MGMYIHLHISCVRTHAFMHSPLYTQPHPFTFAARVRASRRSSPATPVVHQGRGRPHSRASGPWHPSPRCLATAVLPLCPRPRCPTNDERGRVMLVYIERSARARERGTNHPKSTPITSPFPLCRTNSELCVFPTTATMGKSRLASERSHSHVHCMIGNVLHAGHQEEKHPPGHAYLPGAPHVRQRRAGRTGGKEAWPSLCCWNCMSAFAGVCAW